MKLIDVLMPPYCHGASGSRRALQAGAVKVDGCIIMSTEHEVHAGSSVRVGKHLIIDVTELGTSHREV